MKFSSIEAVAESLESPCYILEEAKLLHNLEILKRVSDESGAKILLALKGFAFWSSFDLVAKYLSGITASGLFEARLGFEEFRKHNANAEISVFSPAFKECDIEQILPMANHIIFNSFSQLERFEAMVENSGVEIGLRVNPLYSEVEPPIYNPCISGSRLGIIPSEFEKGVKSRGLGGISGIHFHTHCEQNSDALERTLTHFERHFGKYLSGLKWVNFGGGHHITREDYDVERLIRIIKEFRARHNGIEVYLEPGEAVGWQCGVLVGEVVDIIQNGVQIAVSDISAATHMPDCLEMPYTPKIRNAKICENSPLGSHSQDSNNFDYKADIKSSLEPKLSQNLQSNTANTRILRDKILDSSEKLESSLRESEANEAIYNAESSDLQNRNGNNATLSQTLKSVVGGLGDKKGDKGSDFAFVRSTNPHLHIQVSSPSLKVESMENPCEKDSAKNENLESPQDSTQSNVPNHYRIGSPSCLAGDIIGDYIFEKPLKIGDKLIFEDMIHYTIVKNNTFNGIPLPHLGILRQNGEFEIVKHFDYGDYKHRNG